MVIVGGSMAAVKAPSAVRRLREAGFRTRVIATRAALQFVTPLSLATAADSDVATDETWFAPHATAQHLSFARCDVAVIVGASADLLSRHAHGRADDLASATLLSVRAPVLWVPAMNERMWRHPATQANVAVLRRWGHGFLGPVEGAFGSSGEGEGLGRMAEPEEIAAAARGLLSSPPQDLAGVRVAVSAGPTREYLDPVRYISNPSSGKMGFAVAEVARARGADVTLVTGPVGLADLPGVRTVRVESALEMHAAMLEAARDANVVVMTAAVADYRAADPATEKRPKTPGDVTVTFTPNPDILAALGAEKGERVLVGFAMETDAGVARAAEKARRKNADFILLNYPTKVGTAFGGDDNEVTLVRADGSFEAWPRVSKREVASRLLDAALAVRGG
ncbi:bifunctional phosphopantothenoylcysteine decarboxylase/phosphopantothenate--cysteine ligase CoaBC [Deinococcus maricopensis]|uniref:Coenzyme A biosynthesis bifunctional protein CoaBC n=1 Tax=Deinococcus maricopensis (strain DSM 21211 / LMG 22137 / NRRL B-23946 / LB-34) TaxID=709986 RepID=E8UC74_DEIML|nr:phosphopantothenoylcysteine decarboxylase/phosphopantothenate/cysteine ligase [Deinococcus maricopensis DSM 21211]